VRNKLIVVFHEYFKRFHIAEKHKIMATAKKDFYNRRDFKDKHKIKDFLDFWETLSSLKSLFISCMFLPTLSFIVRDVHQWNDTIALEYTVWYGRMWTQSGSGQSSGRLVNKVMRFNEKVGTYWPVT
jgi:hypothetical protein